MAQRIESGGYRVCCNPHAKTTAFNFSRFALPAITASSVVTVLSPARSTAALLASLTIKATNFLRHRGVEAVRLGRLEWQRLRAITHAVRAVCALAHHVAPHMKKPLSR
jgi:hypothetical protein